MENEEILEPTEGEIKNEMPSWLTELIDRLLQVLTKLLLKLGIKILI